MYNENMKLAEEIRWKNWPYKNTTLLLASLVLFFYFLKSPEIQNFIKTIGTLGYVGSFISGMFFVSIFTVAPASVIIFDVAKTLNPVFVAITAGLGAVIGDYLIFRLLKDRVFEELTPLVKKNGGAFLGKLFSSPFFAWLIPIFGAFIIASPLPDELGISLMGISKIKNWQFLLVTFLLNSVGIFLVIILSKSL